jgi:hypothetical protein
MLSDSELRRLRQLERELERDTPRLASRLRTFWRTWLLLRLAAAALGALAGLVFLCSGAGWGCALFGVAGIAVSSWEFSRRRHQLWPTAVARSGTSHSR